MSNLISNVGVCGSDVTGVGTGRNQLAACEYGNDKGIFIYGTTADSNLVSNTGVVATDVTAVGTHRTELTACSYN